MRTHIIPSCYRKSKRSLLKVIMPPGLALLSTLTGSNCVELIFMVPKVFKPLKFDCMFLWENMDNYPSFILVTPSYLDD